MSTMDAVGTTGLKITRGPAAPDQPPAKPHWRGWLHVGTFPLAIVAGFVLVSLAPTLQARLALTVFGITAALLFGISALYHRFTWSPGADAALRRFDHANIFLIIAGTYTPFSILLLPGRASRVLLAVVWSGALVGALFRIFWVHAPRWLYVPVYIALGWVAVVYLPELLRSANPWVLGLVVAGGVLYTAGGVIYGLRRPNPSPRWFGFHEVFHALTVLAFVTHCAGLTVAVVTQA